MNFERENKEKDKITKNFQKYYGFSLFLPIILLFKTHIINRKIY